MRIVVLAVILLLGLTLSAAQTHEYAPIQEKEIKYRDWTLRRISDDRELNLRDLSRNKKLVMVVYFAPWCLNWKLQAPFTQRMYDKYKTSGLEIVGVGEYDTIEAMRTSVNNLKITFPIVYESESRAAKQLTAHYQYRRATGDTRSWGSPWNIFLITAELQPGGEFLTEKTFIVNGELIEAETEGFIRQKLGLPKEEKGAAATQSKEIEVCEPEKKTPEFRKPQRW